MLKKLLKKSLILLVLTGVFTTSSLSYANTNIGESYLYKASTSQEEANKEFYLNKALEFYTSEYNQNNKNIEAMIGLGKTYTLLGQRKKAKSMLMQAYNITQKDPRCQLALAFYHNHYQEYNTALEFYKLALISGYLRDYNTNLLTAICYERLGDIKNAKLYYKIALMLNPQSNIAQKNLKELENLK